MKLLTDERTMDNDGTLLTGIPPGEEVHEISHNLSHLLSEQRDWGHKALDTEWFHSQGIYGEGTCAGVVDTGCQLNHPDLQGAISHSKGWVDTNTGEDGNGHGTHCIGIIGARLNNVGYVGVAPKCRIANGKALSNRGSGRGDHIAYAIDFCVIEGKCDVLSLSLGSGMNDPFISGAIDRAYIHNPNLIVVAAAGNDGQRGSPPSWPGALANTIGIAATSHSNLPAPFSTRGNYVDTAAPGVNIVSTWIGSRYSTASGTSMATPYAAGGILLIFAYCDKFGFKRPNRQQLVKLIELTSTDIAPTGKDIATGWGLFNPRKICEWIKANENPAPTPEPEPDDWIQIPAGKTKFKFG